MYSSFNTGSLRAFLEVPAPQIRCTEAPERIRRSIVRRWRPSGMISLGGITGIVSWNNEEGR